MATETIRTIEIDVPDPDFPNGFNTHTLKIALDWDAFDQLAETKGKSHGELLKEALLLLLDRSATSEE